MGGIIKTNDIGYLIKNITILSKSPMKKYNKSERTKNKISQTVIDLEIEFQGHN